MPGQKFVTAIVSHIIKQTVEEMLKVLNTKLCQKEGVQYKYVTFEEQKMGELWSDLT